MISERKGRKKASYHYTQAAYCQSLKIKIWDRRQWMLYSGIISLFSLCRFCITLFIINMFHMSLFFWVFPLFLYPQISQHQTLSCYLFWQIQIPEGVSCHNITTNFLLSIKGHSLFERAKRTARSILTLCKWELNIKECTVNEQKIIA